MSGLREALEKLVQGWQYVGEPVDMTRTDSVMDDCADELKRLLAAHPAEPAPVITDEVVEAAAQAYWESDEGIGMFRPTSRWVELIEVDPYKADAYRRAARAILKAAKVGAS